MVCTLLAGFNVVAFAADDIGDTISVQKFYNDATKGGDGEHLFTKDDDEISWLASLPTWNDEGEAWKAPVASTTSVYRCYNPNSGEHLYVDEDYADYLAANGWNKEKLAFYSDDEMGVPVYRLWNGADGVGSHHFTTDAGEVDWLVSLGWAAEDIAFYGVAEEESDIIIYDVNGLQADGTGQVGDTLILAGIPAYVGVPSAGILYVDGMIANVYEDFAAIAELTFAGIDTDFYGKGAYTLVIFNTEGMPFVSNEIVIGDTLPAMLSGFNISDNYDAILAASEVEDPALAAAILGFGPSLNPETDAAVVDVTLNKLYDGILYIVPFGLEEYDPADFANSIVIDPNDLEGSGIIPVDPEEFSNTTLVLTDIEYVEEFGEEISGICTENLDGSYSFKFFSDLTGAATVTRGEQYVVLFDQGQFDPEDPTTWNITAPLVCPYVLSPDDIEVTDVQESVTDEGWTATLTFHGLPAEWVFFGDDEGEIAVTLYSNTSTDLLSAHEFENNVDQIAMAGVYGTFAAGQQEDAYEDDTYVFAVFEAPAGIFGEDELYFISEPTMIAEPVADAAESSYNPLAPFDIKTSFTNLREDSYVILVNGLMDPTEINIADPTTYVSVTEARAGAPSVTFVDVIDGYYVGETPEQTFAGNMYYVVVVPKTDTNYTLCVGAPDFVEQEAIAYYLAGDGVLAGSTGGSIVVTGDTLETFTTFVAIDQFGDVILDPEDDTFVGTGLTTQRTLRATTDEVDELEFAPKLTVDADLGFLNVVFDYNHGDVEVLLPGYSWKYSTAYSTVTLTVVEGGVVTTDGDATGVVFLLTFE